MTYVLCTLDKYGYRHKLRICNTYCFSTAAMVTRTRLNITLYVHCLSFLLRDEMTGNRERCIQTRFLARFEAFAA